MSDWETAKKVCDRLLGHKNMEPHWYLFCVDPGSEKSGWVLWSITSKKVIACGNDDNKHIEYVVLPQYARDPWILFVCEMPEIIGQKIWAQIFPTCYWVGRFARTWESTSTYTANLMSRAAVKDTLLGRRNMPKADQVIMQLLIERFGGKGVKANKGPMFGMSSHTWQALGMGIAWLDMNHKESINRGTLQRTEVTR